MWPLRHRWLSQDDQSACQEHWHAEKLSEQSKKRVYVSVMSSALHWHWQVKRTSMHEVHESNSYDHEFKNLFQYGFFRWMDYVSDNLQHVLTDILLSVQKGDSDACGPNKLCLHVNQIPMKAPNQFSPCIHIQIHPAWEFLYNMLNIDIYTLDAHCVLLPTRVRCKSWQLTPLPDDNSPPVVRPVFAALQWPMTLQSSSQSMPLGIPSLTFVKADRKFPLAVQSVLTCIGVQNDDENHTLRRRRLSIHQWMSLGKAADNTKHPHVRVKVLLLVGNIWWCTSKDTKVLSTTSGQCLVHTDTESGPCAHSRANEEVHRDSLVLQSDIRSRQLEFHTLPSNSRTPYAITVNLR